MLPTAIEPARMAGRRVVTTTAKKRSPLVTLHLWLGLTLGAVLVLIGLSGSAMIFRYELERAFFPSLTHSTGSGAGDLDACLAAAQALNPGKSVRSLLWPVNVDGTQEWLTIPAGQTTKEQATTVYTDPHTCAVLGTRGPRKDSMSWVVNFHHALLLGKNGRYLQTCVALAAIFLAMSGLIQWWPNSFTWSRLQPRARARPLHYAVGFWAMWPLLLIATTAIYMAWRLEINKSLLGGASARIAGPTSTAAKKIAASLTLSAVMATARAARPDAAWRVVTLPQKPKEPFTITYQLPGEYGRTGGNQMSLKPNPDGTARVIAIVELRNSSRMQRFLDELMQIHYGEFGGFPTRLLWCVTGFMPAVLFFSGLLMWRRRVGAQTASQRVLEARLLPPKTHGLELLNPTSREKPARYGAPRSVGEEKA
jgi:uncharacterized iron-regulated membrane protein